jgi:hypothetical protein
MQVELGVKHYDIQYYRMQSGEFEGFLLSRRRREKMIK